MNKYSLIIVAFLFCQKANTQPDLTIVPNSLSVTPDNVHVGITVNVTFSAQNIGDASSSTTTTGLYLSVSTDPAAGLFLGNISLEPLAAGASSNDIQCRFPIPYTIGSSGNFNLIVKLNTYQTAVESNYSNNTSYSPIYINSSGWAAQNLPYPVIFIHGLKGDETAWDELITFVKNYYGWSYGGNMNFCLNQDANLETSDTTQGSTNDYKDWTDYSSLYADDFYTVNFDVDNYGTPHDIDIESNQSAIVKQGLAVRDAIKHVLNKTGRDKVILVGHSMGGLASRQYLQNKSIWKEPYIDHHVAKLVTIGTPHGGSNATLGPLSGLAGILGQVDELSEAVRDLRYSYYTGYEGAFLFGGEENEDKIRGALSAFHNIDVNCNGSIGGNISGLNNKWYPVDLNYSCIIGTGNLLGGDGVVSATRANINNYLQVSADTFILEQPFGDNSIWHMQIEKKPFAFMKAIDESNTWVGSYQVSSGQLYYGTVTVQSYGATTVKDYDTYKINVPTNRVLNIQIYNINKPQFYISVYNSSHASVFSASSNGKSYVNINTPILSGGNYYVVLYATPTPDSWYYPYAFKITVSAPTTSFCSESTTLTAVSGTLSDGSGANNYNNNSDCSWKIQPSGATSITLNFNDFDIIEPGDTVYIYNGGTINSPLLGKWTGNTLPPSVTSSGGKMLIRFVTDASIVSSGWSATYTSVVTPTFCNGTTILTSSTGTFSDGSGVTDYGNNSNCSWLINPPGATSITLTFNSFNVEAVNDLVNVYDGNDNTSDLIGSYSGTSIPVTLTSSGGAMFIEFITNESVTAAGWAANYSSDVPLISDGIVEYEYWYDNNHQASTIIPVVLQNNLYLNNNFSTSTLGGGLHVFNIRFKDNNEKWSSIVSSFFYKPVQITSGAAQYEYWFDSDYQNKTTVNNSSTNNFILLDNLVTGSLAEGLHSMNIRFKPDGKAWSSISSSFFYKTGETISGQAQYEYWFDDDYAGKQTTNITSTGNMILLDSFNTVPLNNGLHTLHFRSRPDGKAWSVITSNFFYKSGDALTAINNLAKYICWIDNNWQTPHTITITGVSNLNWTLNLDLDSLANGPHSISQAFKDDRGKWSSIITDNFTKVSVTAPACQYVNREFASGIITGSGSTFQWQIDDGSGFTDLTGSAYYSGINSDTLHLANVPTTWYGYKYRCIVTSSGNTYTGQTHLLKFAMKWMGSVDNAWENAANWNCNVVPDANTDVYINTGLTRYPQVGENAACRSLNLQPGTSLDVLPGKKLDITGINQ